MPQDCASCRHVPQGYRQTGTLPFMHVFLGWHELPTSMLLPTAYHPTCSPSPPAQAAGQQVSTGAWAVDSEEAEYLEQQAAQEAAFQKILDARKEWLKPPAGTPYSLVPMEGPSSKVQPEKLMEGLDAANGGEGSDAGGVAT